MWILLKGMGGKDESGSSRYATLYTCRGRTRLCVFQPTTVAHECPGPDVGTHTPHRAHGAATASYHTVLYTADLETRCGLRPLFSSFPLFSAVSELLQVETGCTRLERQTRTARHTRLHRTSTQGLKNNTTRGTTRSRSRRPALYTRRRGVSTPAAGGPALDEHAGETGHPSCQLRAANATLGCEKDAQLGRDAE